MACYLRIFGDFDPDELLQFVDLPVESTWRKGESASKRRVHDQSGIQLTPSDAGFQEFEKQLSETEAFLRRHRKAIAQLTKRDDVNDAVIDFGIEKTNHPASFRRLPRSLVEIAAELGLAIELSLYAESEGEAAQ